MRRRTGRLARHLRRAIAGLGVASILTLLAPALAVVAPAPVHAGGDDLEYRVKAEFIERFTHFIEWPPTAFAGPDAPFVLCVVGDTPVAALPRVDGARAAHQGSPRRAAPARARRRAVGAATSCSSPPTSAPT